MAKAKKVTEEVVKEGGEYTFDDLGLDIRKVSVDDIEANDYNPNSMEEELFEVLVATLKEEGKMVQPVLLIANPHLEEDLNAKPYMVVDGEHRWKASKAAGLKYVVAVVVPLTDAQAKIRTISMNNIRGNYIPMRMAKLIVGLQNEHGMSEADIRRMTGIREDEFKALSSLLDVPDIDFTEDSVSVTLDDPERPVYVNLVLLPNEHKEYQRAMTLAMESAGPLCVPLIGDEVEHYDTAMSKAMGITGVKLRNVGLACICHTFNEVLKALDGKKATINLEAVTEIIHKMARTKVDKSQQDDEGYDSKDVLGDLDKADIAVNDKSKKVKGAKSVETKPKKDKPPRMEFRIIGSGNDEVEGLGAVESLLSDLGQLSVFEQVEQMDDYLIAVAYNPDGDLAAALLAAPINYIEDMPSCLDGPDDLPLETAIFIYGFFTNYERGSVGYKACKGLMFYFMNHVREMGYRAGHQVFLPETMELDVFGNLPVIREKTLEDDTFYREFELPVSKKELAQ